jgi:hypothetical protein
MRRRTLLGATSGALLATSGCLGVLTGSEALEEEAAEPRVDEAALEETGYELAETSTDTIEREVSAGEVTREVRAVNQLAEYRRSVDLAALGEEEYGVFAVVATPAFEIGDRTMSPVERWSNRKLAAEVQKQYSDLEVGAEAGQRSVAALQSKMDVSTFEGTATVAGNEGVEIFLHAGKVRHDEDFVLVVGVHPQRLPDESEHVDTLVRNLTH